MSFAFALATGSLAAAQAGVAPAVAPRAESVSPAPGDPSSEVQAQYREVVARAVTEFDAARWAEARALFLRAHELWPSARTLRTLGMTSFELRAYAQALQELQAALADPRRPLSEDQRAQVSALIEQTRAFVGTYRVQLAPAAAQLLVDGAPRSLAPDGMLLLEVGSHELRARAPGHVELARKLDVRGGEDEALALELSREAPAAAAAAPAPALAPVMPAQRDARGEHGGLLFTWIAGGSAVALGGGSLVLWLMSDAKFDAQKKKCDALPGGGCARGTIETAGIQDLQTAHQVTAVLAGVAGAAAVVLFFVEGGGQNAQLAIGPGGVLARGRF